MVLARMRSSEPGHSLMISVARQWLVASPRQAYESSSNPCSLRRKARASAAARLAASSRTALVNAAPLMLALLSAPAALPGGASPSTSRTKARTCSSRPSSLRAAEKASARAAPKVGSWVVRPRGPRRERTADASVASLAPPPPPPRCSCAYWCTSASSSGSVHPERSARAARRRPVVGGAEGGAEGGEGQSGKSLYLAPPYRTRIWGTSPHLLMCSGRHMYEERHSATSGTVTSGPVVTSR